MSLFESKHTKAQNKIAKIEMGNYIKKAKELFDLDDSQVEKAKQEYRHFLYLIFCNRHEGNKQPVVPTKRADILWHAHLLFNAEYNEFCLDLFGEIIAHRPGLEEGTDPFITAVLHTKELHDRIGNDGFDKDYFSFVEHKIPTKKRDDAGSRSNTQAAGDCSYGISPSIPATGDGGVASSCGGASSCGAGCGGGCGG